MKKKVLYLHGLNSKLHDDRREILEKFDLNIVAPIIDYENEPERLNQLVKEFDADLVIGSSAGGLAGYYLSGLMKVPALLFNPALPFRSYMKPIPDISERKQYLQIVLGAGDDVVPAMETFKFLNTNIHHGLPLHIHWIQNLKHIIPIDVFESEVTFFLHKNR